MAMVAVSFWWWRVAEKRREENRGVVKKEKKKCPLPSPLPFNAARAVKFARCPALACACPALINILLPALLVDSRQDNRGRCVSCLLA